MGRPVHFELPADDTGRAVEFYRQVFGWEISTWGGPVEYWLIATGGEGEPGIDGAILPRKDAVRDQGTINTISVASVDAAAEKVVEAGGRVITPKATIPGYGYHIYCEDTEGNVFGIMEADESAR